MSPSSTSEEQPVLSAKRVMAIVEDCLYREDEWSGEGDPPADMVLVHGIVGDYGFHPERLHSHADEISDMLAELPTEFMQTGGGGMSFLNACMDRHGTHWAEHPTMGWLFGLGMGVGKVDCMFPREMWPALPGAVPYYVVKDGAR